MAPNSNLSARTTALWLLYSHLNNLSALSGPLHKRASIKFLPLMNARSLRRFSAENVWTDCLKFGRTKKAGVSALTAPPINLETEAFADYGTMKFVCAPSPAILTPLEL